MIASGNCKLNSRGQWAILEQVRSELMLLQQISFNRQPYFPTEMRDKPGVQTHLGLTLSDTPWLDTPWFNSLVPGTSFQT